VRAPLLAPEVGHHGWMSGTETLYSLFEVAFVQNDDPDRPARPA
jgi:hypothetical protein